MPASIGVNLRVTGHCRQGGRKYMEDYFSVAYQQTEDEKDLEYAFFGIYDGHGGAEAAAFAKEHLMESIVKHKSFWSEDDEEVLRSIKDGFIATHYAMWRIHDKWPKTSSGLPSTAGTTASIAFIRRGKIYIGHVGDSGITLGFQDEGCPYWRAKPLTNDHKPESEVEHARIEQSGGKVVTKSGVPRVVWNRPRIGHKGPVRRSTPIDEIPFLAVARSLGDLWSYNPALNEFVVSPAPDCYALPINTDTFRCLIFGTDGLYNMLSAHMTVHIVQQAEKHNEQATLQPAEQSRVWINPSKCLVEKALERWGNTKMRADNTSVITLMLDPPGPPRAEVLRNKRNSYTSSGLQIETRYQDGVGGATSGECPELRQIATDLQRIETKIAEIDHQFVPNARESIYNPDDANKLFKIGINNAITPSSDIQINEISSSSLLEEGGVKKRKNHQKQEKAARRSLRSSDKQPLVEMGGVKTRYSKSRDTSTTNTKTSSLNNNNLSQKTSESSSNDNSSPKMKTSASNNNNSSIKISDSLSNSSLKTKTCGANSSPNTSDSSNNGNSTLKTKTSSSKNINSSLKTSDSSSNSSLKTKTGGLNNNNASLNTSDSSNNGNSSPKIKTSNSKNNNTSLKTKTSGSNNHNSSLKTSESSNNGNSTLKTKTSSFSNNHNSSLKAKTSGLKNNDSSLKTSDSSNNGNATLKTKTSSFLNNDNSSLKTKRGGDSSNNACLKTKLSDPSNNDNSSLKTKANASNNGNLTHKTRAGDPSNNDNSNTKTKRSYLSNNDNSSPKTNASNNGNATLKTKTSASSNNGNSSLKTNAGDLSSNDNSNLKTKRSYLSNNDSSSLKTKAGDPSNNDNSNNTKTKRSYMSNNDNSSLKTKAGDPSNNDNANNTKTKRSYLSNNDNLSPKTKRSCPSNNDNASSKTKTSDLLNNSTHKRKTSASNNNNYNKLVPSNNSSNCSTKIEPNKLDPYKLDKLDRNCKKDAKDSRVLRERKNNTKNVIQKRKLSLKNKITTLSADKKKLLQNVLFRNRGATAKTKLAKTSDCNVNANKSDVNVKNVNPINCNVIVKKKASPTKTQSKKAWTQNYTKETPTKRETPTKSEYNENGRILRNSLTKIGPNVMHSSFNKITCEKIINKITCEKIINKITCEKNKSTKNLGVVLDEIKCGRGVRKSTLAQKLRLRQESFKAKLRAPKLTNKIKVTREKKVLRIKKTKKS